MQASWLTVRDSLRDVFAAEGLHVSSDHILTLSRLCPLLVEVGEDRRWHASWAAKRRGAAPDAAEVAVRAQTAREPESADAPADADRADGRPARSAAVDLEADEKPALLELQTGAGVGCAGGCTGAACGGFLTHGTAEAAAAAFEPVAADAEASTVEQKRDDVLDLTGADVGRRAGLRGTDFAIRLQDAPRHVPFVDGKAAAVRKRGAGKRRTKHADAEDGDVVPADSRRAADAAVASAAAHGVLKEPEGAGNDWPVIDGGVLDGGTQAVIQDEPTAFGENGQQDSCADAAAGEGAAEGGPRFAPGSFSARHFAAFRRCVVQAVALLHEVAHHPQPGAPLPCCVRVSVLCCMAVGSCRSGSTWIACAGLVSTQHHASCIEQASCIAQASCIGQASFGSCGAVLSAACPSGMLCSPRTSACRRRCRQ